MKAITIESTKKMIRDGGSFMIDEINDPLNVRQFIYRLEKREILNRDCEDHHYAVYSVIRKDQRVLN